MLNITHKNRNIKYRFTQKNDRKILSIGTAGCIIRPPLLCKGELNRRIGKISKLMEDYEAESEFELCKIIRDLDEEQQYYIWAEHICLPDISAEPDDSFKNVITDIIKKKYKMPNLLIFNDGGGDLWNIEVHHIDLVKFFESLENLFHGLELLHNNNFLHFDIKPANMVCKRLLNGTFHCRFIDFGLARTVKNATSYYLRENYAYWPFDTKLYTNHYIYDEEDVDEFYENQTKGGTYYPKCFLHDRYNNRLLTKNKVTQIHKNIMDEKADKIRLAKSVDIFSLGRSLSEIYGKLLRHRYVNIHTINIEVDDEDMHIHEIIKNEVSFPFYYLCDMMTSVNPFLRPTIKECIEIYKNVLKYMREYFPLLTKNNHPTKSEEFTY
jgi:serine/threonine protein kinase